MGPSSDMAIDLADSLATVLVRQHRYKEAEHILRHHLDVARKTLGPDDVLTIIIVDSLGQDLSEQRRLDEVQKLFWMFPRSKAKDSGSRSPGYRFQS